jgi:pimeloyl-ACP methyl ester carboxylesterase
VRFDHRGVGLSERDVDDFSLDRLVSDLEALVDALEVEQVRMIAFAIGATPALAYAARHPTRVSHLVVVNGSDVGADMAATDALAAVSTLAEQDWVFASEAVTRAFVGWSDEPLTVTRRRTCASRSTRVSGPRSCSSSRRGTYAPSCQPALKASPGTPDGRERAAGYVARGALSSVAMVSGSKRSRSRARA